MSPHCSYGICLNHFGSYPKQTCTTTRKQMDVFVVFCLRVRRKINNIIICRLVAILSLFTTVIHIITKTYTSVDILFRRIPIWALSMDVGLLKEEKSYHKSTKTNTPFHYKQTRSTSIHRLLV